MSTKLLLFDTHPIQYRAPVFRDFCARNQEAQILFFNPAFDGAKWWFHEVGKIPKQDWNLPLMQGYPSQVLELGNLSLWQRYRKIQEVLFQNRPKAVAIFGYYLPEHWILRWVAKRLDIKILFIGETFKNSSVFWRKPVQSALRKYFFSGVDCFLSIGEKNNQYYRSLGVAESKIVKAKYCVDNSFFEEPVEKSSALRKKWREKHQIPENAFVVLFVARLFERKRPQDLIELHRQLQKHAHFYTVVIGNGPLLESLKEQTSQLERVRFLGFQNQNETKMAYHGADVLFLPSEFETWGLVANEAAACRRATVASDTCGVAEDLVLDGKTGFVFPLGQVEKAVQKLEPLVLNPTLCKQLGEQAYKKVQEQYSVQNFSQALSQAYLKVTS